MTSGLNGMSEDAWEHLALDHLAESDVWEPLHGTKVAPGSGMRETWADPAMQSVLMAALVRLNPEVPTQHLQQAPDGLNADGQLYWRLLLRLQREVVFTVEVDHWRARYTMVHQRVGQRFEVPWPGFDAPIVIGPGWHHHHGQARIDM